MRKKGKGSSFLVMVIFLGLIGGGIYLYTSEMFERDVPEITIENSGYWNPKEPLSITIDDQSGLLSYSVKMQSGSETFDLVEEHFPMPQGKQELRLKAPRRAFGLKSESVTITVEASDASKWNFMAGNRAYKQVKLHVDKKRPSVGVISNSYKINKGGSALVIFKAEDENLDELYIETSAGKRFKPQPFYKEGYYISLLAWPVQKSGFRAAIIATDLAGNHTKSNIPLYLKDKKYRLSKIKLSDKFLNGKVSELAEEYGAAEDMDVISKFKFVNEEMRAKNEVLIHKITSKIDTMQIDAFNMNIFYPLKNGKKVASFGDHRLYSYNGSQISESWHLGLDLANVKMGKIKTNNPAEVVFAEENGIYGNMPILAHGLGLYTLYGHCSTLNIQEGDHVNTGDHIANTGRSGYAMGDHLHFGVLVQGVEVRPEEWMDKQWIRLNITDVIKEARKIIDRQQ